MTIVDGLIDAHAAWSPGGDEVAFSGVTAAGATTSIACRQHPGAPSGSQASQLRTRPPWSPDGRSLAFATWEGEVRVVALATGETRTLTRLHHAEIRDLTLSPDGRRLAFVARRVPEGS